MNLLKEGIAQHAVIKTTLTRKLTLDGLTKSYPVYKIKLDWLFYNDQNDRIATWISQYKAQNNGQAPDISNRDAYNAIIEKFIVESNPDAIKKTQTNIEMVDQREPGVVLADGRIIDGNRRFTCLRRLSEKSDRFGFFEAVILDRNIETNAKEIKMLELSIQHGEEAKVDYNPIDRLVGIYNDIIETHLLSVDEYARSTNETESEVRKKIEQANLMVEFLEFINAPKQFYIARDLQIQGPLVELVAILKKCKNDDVAADVKNTVFTHLLLGTNKDMTRYVRSFKSIIGSEYQDEFLEEQCEIAAKVVNALPEEGNVNATVIREQIRSKDNAEMIELSTELDASVVKATTKVKKNETRNRPAQQVEKATAFLESIDTNILLKLSDSELQKFAAQLDKLEKVLIDLRESV